MTAASVDSAAEEERRDYCSASRHMHSAGLGVADAVLLSGTLAGPQHNLLMRTNCQPFEKANKSLQCSWSRALCQSVLAKTCEDHAVYVKQKDYQELQMCNAPA